MENPLARGGYYVALRSLVILSGKRCLFTLQHDGIPYKKRDLIKKSAKNRHYYHQSSFQFCYLVIVIDILYLQNYKLQTTKATNYVT